MPRKVIETRTKTTIYDGKEYTGELEIEGTNVLHLTLHATICGRPLKEISKKSILASDTGYIEYEAEQLFQMLLHNHKPLLKGQ